MDGLGEALRTTGGLAKGGVRWSMLDWMDGDRRGGRQRQLQRRPGAATTAAVGGCGGGRRRRRGRWAWSRLGLGLDALGEVQSGVALEEGGACLARGGVAVGGETQEEVRVRVAKEVQDETQEEFRLGARREGGSRFIWQQGVAENAGSGGDRNSDGEGDRTGRGPAATASAAGTASAATRTQRRPRRRGPGQRRTATVGGEV